MATLDEQQAVTKLLSAATATGAGDAYAVRNRQAKRVFKAKGATSSGTGAATVVIQASLTGDEWLTVGTITLSLATASSADGFACDAAWPLYRANMTAVSGTGAAVTALMGA
jgi:hypothetical protein